MEKTEERKRGEREAEVEKRGVRGGTGKTYCYSWSIESSWSSRMLIFFSFIFMFSVVEELALEGEGEGTALEGGA